MMHLIVLFICFLIGENHLYAQQIEDKAPLVQTEMLSVALDENINFAHLLMHIVEEIESREEGAVSLPIGMKRCCAALKSNSTHISLRDALEAIEGVRQILHRAPREDVSAQVVGPCLIGCNLAGLVKALQQLKISVLQCCGSLVPLTAQILEEYGLCCEAISDEFDFILSFIGGTDIPSDFFATLTTCCASIQSQFQGTWTALEIINACGATGIAAPITITEPGTYCLQNNVEGEIVIASNNVTLNLNGHTILNGTNGISVNGVSEVVIKNGNIQSVSQDGIVLNSGSSDIELHDLMILGAGNRGIFADTLVDQLLVDSVMVTTAVVGFSFNQDTNIVLSNCVAANLVGITSTAVGYQFLSSCTNVRLVNCQTGLNSGTNQQVLGYQVVNSSEIEFDTCRVWNMASNGELTAGFYISDARSVVHKKCYAARFNGVNGATYAYYAENSQNVIYTECDSSGILSTAAAVFSPVNSACFLASGVSGLTYVNCVATEAAASANPLCGFGVLGGSNITYRNCVSNRHLGAANQAVCFCVLPSDTVYSEGVLFFNCLALATNSHGFNLTQGSGSLYNCVATNCGADGFLVDNSLGTPDGLWVFQECLSCSNTGTGFESTTGVGSVAPFNLYAAFNNVAQFAGFPAVFTQGDQFDCVGEIGGIPAAGNVAG
jgi:hypothetical protein